MLIYCLLALGFFVGIIASMLGLGGGVLTIPALVIFFPELGLKTYSMQSATAISAFTSLFSALSGFYSHYKKGFIPLKEVQPIFITSTISGILGTWFSTLLSDEQLQWLFFLVLMVILVLEIKRPRTKVTPSTEENSNGAHFNLSDRTSIAVCSLMSFVVSQIGIGGSILFIPYLLVIKNVPIRYAIGAGSCFVITNAIAVLIGKLTLNLIPWPDMLYVAIGAIIGGQLGGYLSHKISEKWLRRLLITMILLTIIRFALNLIF